MALGAEAAAQSLPAADPDSPLSSIVISARGYPTPLGDIPGGIFIADETEILRSPRKGSVVDALDGYPGITRTGDSPYGQDISIRGLSGPSVVILINGKRINTATDMNARLGYLNPADISRVEVLKGPLSALYGSGSTGGVVNIITRKPTDFASDPQVHGRFSLSASSNPLGGLAYSYLEFASPRFLASVAAGGRRYGSTYGYSRSKVPNSQFRDVYGRASFSIKASDRLVLTTEAIRAIAHDVGIPGGNSAMPSVADVTYPRGEFTLISQDLSWDVSGAYLQKIEASVYYSANRRRALVDKVGPTSPVQPIDLWPKADHDTYGGNLTSTWNFGDHTLLAGADFWTWDMESSRRRTVRAPTNQLITSEDKPSPKSRQVSIGFFASDSYAPSPKWRFYFGGRIDRLRTHNDDLFSKNPVNLSETLVLRAGTARDWGWQAHLGATYAMTENWSSRLLLSSAYRAADIMERFKYLALAGNLTIYGNPNLKPERGIFAEYELEYSGERLSSTISLFANFIRDYIAEQPESPTVRRTRNIATARILGAELEASFALPRDLSLEGSLSYLYGKDRENDAPLPGIAPFKSRLALEYRPANDSFWARVEEKYVAAQRRVPPGGEPSSHAFLTGLSVGYAFRGRVNHELSLTLDNIFDRESHNYLARERGYTIWEPGFNASINYALSF
ncbi:MAG: TonB-dependent receptor [Deltaproteobacteria bacterium]|nr:TonB-dependent receptor [Deltaproteobacteria bacterium]